MQSPEDTPELPLPGDPTPARLRLYLIPILLFPMVLLVAAFFIVPSDWFIQRSGSTYLANFAFGDTLQNHDCQILVYGDSTAMVGVSPATLTARTGLTACNIAEFEGMTLVTRTLLVDRFLAHNPRPRFLVFLYTPEDLAVPNSWDKVSTFEATSWLIRHDLTPATAWQLAMHPASTFGWAEQGLRMTAQRLRARPFPPETLALRATTIGQLPMAGRTITGCTAERHDTPPDTVWLQSLRSHYGTGGTQVLIDATPTVPCDPSLDTYRKQLAGVVDDLPYNPIPLDSYTDDGRLHANAVGTERISGMIATQILSKMEAPR